MSWLLLACAEPGAPTLDETAATDRPRTVVWLTIDTLNEDWLGGALYDASPALDGLHAESVVFENTVVTRGVTVVSLPSIATGAWPRTHQMRDKVVPPDMPPMVQQVLADAGFRTFAYSSNRCEVFQAAGWERSTCTAPDVLTDHADDQERDAMLVEAFLEDLDALADHESAFFWLHLRDPHSTHTPRQPWIEGFYAGDYPDQSPIETSEMEAMLLGEPIPEGFVDWLHAVYASEVRSDDALVAEVLAALDEADRRDLVVTGTDHGEELGAHHDYWMHGCSFYDEVIDTTWSIRDPDLAPGRVEERISTVDLLPTTLELLGLSIEADGRSVLPLARGESLPLRGHFFERGLESAGVVLDDRKYFLHADPEPFSDCTPYALHEGTSWPGPEEALFDLAADPGERTNLLGDEPDPPERDVLCGWVTEAAWQTEAVDRSNDLVGLCGG